jgi:AmmeMemoRadiSam system protein B
MTAANHPLPKLRSVDARPIVHSGQHAILIRDPLQLTDEPVIIPQHLGPALALFDGTRDAHAVSASMAVRYGVPVSASTLESLLATLDNALLLENERFVLAQLEALAVYRQAPFRPPVGAGSSYPAEPDELRRLLQGHWQAAEGVEPAAGGRGLLSPHIDYARGGSVYGSAWRRAAEMAKAAEIVLLLGTDHFSEGNLLTLTRQSYATPFGALPTATEVVDALAQAVGPDKAFEGELHHKGEHSIELAAVWLHHARGERPCAVVPVLCGSFQGFVQGDADPGEDVVLTAFVDACRQALAGRQALVVAAADLAHIGPAFGGRPVGLVERARLQAADDQLMERICAGDATGFFTAIHSVQDRHNVCGLPPIYLALRILNPVCGEQVAYLRCPADQAGTSLVSICGIVFE